jgi:CRISPR/Cas system-associated exonuclease Cas4 (RecB family)
MGAPPARPGTTSPSDLAEYAFCPRSHWYRYHPPARGPSPDGLRRSAAGTRFHARSLAATRSRSEHGAGLWVAVVLGLLLALGGLWWLLR